MIANDIAHPHPRVSGLEPGADGQPIGRDPRRMSPADLVVLGHQPMSPGRALRLRCLDCCGGQPTEVRACTAVRCPAWPFRMGANPWREVSDAKREAGRRLAARQARGAENLPHSLGQSEPDEMPAALVAADLSDAPGTAQPAETRRAA
jgi:hypothetical protein